MKNFDDFSNVAEKVGAKKKIQINSANRRI